MSTNYTSSSSGYSGQIQNDAHQTDNVALVNQLLNEMKNGKVIDSQLYSPAIIPDTSNEKSQTFTAQRDFVSSPRDQVINNSPDAMNESILRSAEVVNTPVNSPDFQKLFDSLNESEQSNVVSTRTVLDLMNGLVDKPAKKVDPTHSFLKNL